MTISHKTPGRYSKLSTTSETSHLTKGLDFRKPEYRREVFLRFFEFHCKYRSNPGCVYFLIPYLAKTYNWNTEQKLWFAYINGHTQNPITSLIIFRHFPEPDKIKEEILRKWFNKEYLRLEFDSDRLKNKNKFIPKFGRSAVVEYLTNTRINNGQQQFFSQFGNDFSTLWKVVSNTFYSFGRLSTFSYLEYLKIVGLPIECNTLFLDDLEGSKSHRNGLVKVLGRDDLDWHNSNLTNFQGKYTTNVMNWLKDEAEVLLQEAKVRSWGKPWSNDVSYFTLESCLCTFKSWFRPNRRYPNVYVDMLYGRIKRAEERWIEEDFSIFWKARKECLPSYLLLECCPEDPGLCKRKQNHFRETGEVVMMDKDWGCFENSFNKGLE